MALPFFFDIRAYHKENGYCKPCYTDSPTWLK
jgi:hypothetical protein